MRAVMISSIGLKLIGIAFLIFEIYLKNDTMEITERYLNIIIAIISVFSLLKPKWFIVHLIQVAHFIYLIFKANNDLKKKLETMEETEAKNMFMAFFLFFSSAFNDFDLCIKSGKKVVFEFRYFLINITGMVVEFLSATLIWINYIIDKEFVKKNIVVKEKKE